MSGNAAIVMILIGSFVWGGFLLILLTAIRKERNKAAAAAGSPAADGAATGGVGLGARGGDGPDAA